MAWLRLPDKLKNLFGATRIDLGMADDGGHAAIVEADPYSFRIAHRRLAWMLRMSVGLNVVLGFVAISVANAVAVLVPLKTTEIALVRSDPQDNRLYRIEPLSQTVQGFDVVLEDKARRYVRLLLEIDRITQTERFREAFRMMDAAFYARFKKDHVDNNEVQNAINSGLTRSITIESVDRIQSFHKTFKFAVDFIQTDTRHGQVIETRKLRAYLNMTTRSQDGIPVEDKYENPLGIVVLDLVLKERGNS